MKEYIISNFLDLKKKLDKNRKSNLWIYRGQSNSEWDLEPKVARVPYSDYNDFSLIDSWKRRASIFISKPVDSLWDWLTLAQHHGVPTRLLDWTFTPLVAAFFAAIENPGKDGTIFAYDYRATVLPEKISPFEINENLVFRPSTINPRVFSQSSIFTVHKEPFEALTNKNCNGKIEKWIIKNKYKKELQHELNQMGINYSTIFQDLDGLSKHVCWHIENLDYWVNKQESIYNI